jgi:hypothetical protein
MFRSHITLHTIVCVYVCMCICVCAYYRMAKNELKQMLGSKGLTE